MSDDWKKGYDAGIDDTHQYYDTYRLHPVSAEAFITSCWGPRCETKDVDDFPELKDEPNGRCACCEMWEIYDNYKSTCVI